MSSSASSQRFDKIASNFATSEVHTMSPTIKRLHELLGNGSFDSVCDVACGAGHLALSFASRAKRVVGVDPAPNMLDAFRKLAEQKGVTVEIIRSSSEELPFPDNSFDIVVSRLAPHHFVDIQRSTKEMARILKREGLAAVIDLEGDPDPEVDEFNHVLEVLHDPTHHRSHTAAQWKFYFNQAKLEIVTQETKLAERPTGVPIKRWCEIASSGAVAEDEIRDRLRGAPQRFIDSLGIWKDGEEYFMPIRTMLVVGRKV